MNRVGVIGFPIDHSLSPAMHNAALAALGMDGEWLYDKIAIPPDIVKLGLRELCDHGYLGVNVTIPHKQAVMPYVKADDIAQKIGAVNTIDFRTNIGTNTDVTGFMDDLAAHGIGVAGERVIILGAGGAARAAVYGLAQAGARIVVVNRSPDKAEAMLQSLDVTGAVLSAPDALERGAALLVNATSVGMHPNSDESPLPADAPIPSGITLYDMIYRPARTRLMAQVEAAGGRAINGLGMLVRQGAAAFRLWTGIEPPLDVMRQAAQAALEEQP
jgi:shikimate dehydrogenase